MNRTTLVISGLVISQVALAILAYRQEQTNLRLSEQLNDLKSITTVLSGKASDSEQALKAVRSEVTALGKLPSAADIATAMTSGASPAIVSLLSDRLKADTKFRDSIKGQRGEKGPSPEVDIVVKAIVTCCAPSIIDAVWRAGRPELLREVLQNDGLIADVAKRVDDDYGAALRGKDGQSPPTDSVVQQLATDLGFAQLVANTIKMQ